MAGSYEHLVAEDGAFTFDFIDGMGDAHEACEDCFNHIARLKAENERLQRLAHEVFMGKMSWQEYFEALGCE